MGDISKAVAMVCVALIDAVTLAMTVRAIMSWFFDDGNSVHSFFISITEPFVIPIRKLFDKLSLGKGMPIDLPFMTAFFVLIILQTILGIYF